jgi:hypothetical protein
MTLLKKGYQFAALGLLLIAASAINPGCNTESRKNEWGCIRKDENTLMITLIGIGAHCLAELDENRWESPVTTRLQRKHQSRTPLTTPTNANKKNTTDSVSGEATVGHH